LKFEHMALKSVVGDCATFQILIHDLWPKNIPPYQHSKQTFHIIFLQSH
jgi:hypothetical protein